MDQDLQARLSRIEAQQATTIVLLQQLSEKVCKHVDGSDKVLHGNNGSPGLIVRLDRLEQAAERGRWLTRAIVTAIVGLLVSGIWAALN